MQGDVQLWTLPSTPTSMMPQPTNPFQDPSAGGPSQIDPEPHADPPPAYTPSATQMQSTTLEAGPQRMDFSGPPPVPHRFQAPQMTGGGTGQLVNGVGYGYGPRMHQAPVTGPMSPQGYGSPGPAPMHPHSTGSQAPVLPPRQPSKDAAPPPEDKRPTSVPTPGRPLLHDGMLLVYPRDHWCKKCNNTGYKQHDPSHPCRSDWKKYGKPYTGPLMISYASSTPNGANTSTSASENFQRPLPELQHRPPPPHQGIMSHPGLIPNGSHGGGGGYQPQGSMGYGPPSMPMHGYGPPVTQHGFGPPPGAVVLRAGDPRIGGQLCYKCGGDGWIDTFLGFDTEQCYRCRGMGRIF